MIKIGVLGSTKGTDLQAVINSIDKNELSAEIAVIISNKEKSYILKRGRNHNIPSMFISHKSKSREEFDREISAVLDNQMFPYHVQCRHHACHVDWFYLLYQKKFCK